MLSGGKISIAFWILVAIAIGLGAFLYIKELPPPFGKYDAFAKCIANTSTTFYGAAWCPHCAEQKNEFGDAAQYLPYVECSPQPGEETEACVKAGVKNYPTWHFPDNTTSSGVQSLQKLSEETGCSL